MRSRWPPCVGNGVPWVRAGVGAVATQASTRTAYGDELLDMLEQGVEPPGDAGARDGRGRVRRATPGGGHCLNGSSAQHTGAGPGF
ncbi:MAG: DUF1028 domain-containing protein [Gemmatimonadetes bacterium]|nr:DUF1028 domain-containing protein [Gemmatimonadota bacterium]